MCTGWDKDFPSHHITIFPILHGVIFVGYYITARQDGYQLIFLLGSHDKEQDNFSSSFSSGGGICFPKTSTTESLKLLYIKINSIESWLQILYNNHVWCCV